MDVSNGNGDAPCPLGPVNDSALWRSHGDVSTQRRAKLLSDAGRWSKEDGWRMPAVAHARGTSARSRDDIVVALYRLFVYLFISMTALLSSRIGGQCQMTHRDTDGTLYPTSRVVRRIRSKG